MLIARSIAATLHTNVGQATADRAAAVDADQRHAESPHARNDGRIARRQGKDWVIIAHRFPTLGFDANPVDSARDDAVRSGNNDPNRFG